MGLGLGGEEGREEEPWNPGRLSSLEKDPGALAGAGPNVSLERSVPAKYLILLRRLRATLSLSARCLLLAIVAGHKVQRQA